MNAPIGIQRQALELGFEITTWSPHDGGIRGLPSSPHPGLSFAGSHGEILAFLDGFSTCLAGAGGALDSLAGSLIAG